jgi:hypothetical protein
MVAVFHGAKTHVIARFSALRLISSRYFQPPDFPSELRQPSPLTSELSLYVSHRESILLYFTKTQTQDKPRWIPASLHKIEISFLELLTSESVLISVVHRSPDSDHPMQAF